MSHETDPEYDDTADPSNERPFRHKSRRKPKQNKWQIAASLCAPETDGDGDSRFSPVVDATNEERDWIAEHLADFHHGRWITRRLFRVKAGKEANVYCCAGHPDSGLDWIAAKLYSARKLRALKNTGAYSAGRAFLDARGRVEQP